jgi:hypothetical protein
VLPQERPEEIQLAAALPSTWDPLDQDETAAIRPYFRWEQRDDFWWETLRPARFRVQRLTNAVEIGRLVEQGEIVALAQSPSHRPTDRGHVFGVFRERSAGEVIIGDPWGPEPVRSALLYESPGLRAIPARFPAEGREIVWLWSLTSVGSSGQQADALRRNIDLLRFLNDTVPGSAVTVLHYGRLDAEEFRGLYVATTWPRGFEVREGLSLVERDPADRDRAVRAIGADLALSLSAIHGAGLCAGVLTPGLLRIRPAPDVSGRMTYRAMLVALPAGGPEGDRVAASVQRQLTKADAEVLGPATRPPFRRTVLTDLMTLGECLIQILGPAEPATAAVRPLLKSLRDGKIDSAAAAAGLLAGA